jgi:demethylmenaquinone methyltransferase/2-methoxy-6-polyprenyl-1,4-benzoquinol methylase
MELSKIKTPEQKGIYVKQMFSDAASQYDVLNDRLSMFLHRYWKRFAVNKSGAKEGSSVIDICAGTQDITILLAKKVTTSGEVVALDFNKDMLSIGQKKAMKKGVAKQIKPLVGDATNIFFPDNTFDAATVGFGFRNVTDLNKALKEMLRIIKPGSKGVILEFSHPQHTVFCKLFNQYTYKILPKIGKKFSATKDGYDYLPRSISKFPDQEKLKKLMENAGFKNVSYTNLAHGVVAVHVGEK